MSVAACPARSALWRISSAPRRPASAASRLVSAKLWAAAAARRPPLCASFLRDLSFLPSEALRPPVLRLELLNLDRGSLLDLDARLAVAFRAIMSSPILVTVEPTQRASRGSVVPIFRELEAEFPDLSVERATGIADTSARVTARTPSRARKYERLALSQNSRR